MLNYEQHDAPDKMVEDLDSYTLGEVREGAIQLDALFLEHARETKTSVEELAALSEEIDAHIFETLKYFSDYYEGKPLSIMLSGLLHTALTLVYTCSYELEQAEMRADLEQMGVLDDDQA